LSTIKILKSINKFIGKFDFIDEFIFVVKIS